MTSDSNKAKIKKYLVESAMIVFSVLFALFINECTNDYNKKKATDLLLNNIKKEIITNEEFTQGLLDYHETVITNIKKTIETDSIEERFYSKNGFNLFDVAPWGIIQGNYKNIAWEVAKSNDISSRIPFPKSEALFEVYSQQQNINDTVDRIIEILITREIQKKDLLKESVIILMGEFEEIVGQEKILLKRYEKANEALND